MPTDSELQKRVLAELNREPSVTAGHIGVSAKAGAVTLSGRVESYLQKRAVERVVRRVKGVKAVVEEIEVRLPSAASHADDEIAAAAVQRLASDSSLPRYAIAIEVEKGWVTLFGEVGWHYQREVAEDDIHGLQGVVGVTDRIALKPRVNVENLSDDIMHAMGRSWLYDTETVHVRAEDGKVTLSGTVATLSDRDLATKTAWVALGKSEVRNDLAIV